MNTPVSYLLASVVHGCSKGKNLNYIRPTQIYHLKTVCKIFEDDESLLVIRGQSKEYQKEKRGRPSLTFTCCKPLPSFISSLCYSLEPTAWKLAICQQCASICRVKLKISRPACRYTCTSSSGDVNAIEQVSEFILHKRLYVGDRFLEMTALQV